MRPTWAVVRALLFASANICDWCHIATRTSPIRTANKTLITNSTNNNNNNHNNNNNNEIRSEQTNTQKKKKKKNESLPASTIAKLAPLNNRNVTELLEFQAPNS
jgi:hypothetical protein